MSAALHVIAGSGAGRLATIAHPRADAWPAERLSELAGAGVDVLVSALTAAEQEELGLGGCAAAAAAAGLEFVAFPEDGGGVPPEEAAEVVGLAARLAGQVRAGRFVATQCFGGLGRSTLLACATQVLLGFGPGDTLRRVTGDPAAPITRDWLYRTGAAVTQPYV